MQIRHPVKGAGFQTDALPQAGLGYLTTGLLFAGIIGAIAFGYFALKLDGIAAFWLAYILTRPLGASFGDLLSQPIEHGGLGFGTIVTSLLFLGCIVSIVIYMSTTHRIRVRPTEA